MSLIEKLTWRYATKKFDKTKKLTPLQLEELLHAVHLSPASTGVQSYKIIVIEDAATREKLQQAAYGQSQIVDGSQLIVFAAETNLDDQYVKKLIDHVAKTRGIDRVNLEGYEQMINGKVNSMNKEERITWAKKQAYIALGVLLTSAAELGIDACPMEGFSAPQFDEILGLKEKGLTTAVIAAVGFRAADDAYSKLSKVRKPEEEMFIHI
ncbi:nitroreductase family protein [Mucilaginibacter sp. BT774]|uniref:nitroreductase family protein n=1 Tax=Mucilaginibacter sp. BT774 TaxID=3062276 RepID=UPI002676EF77|nr:nitroreductase family protein [Mucilaginibacter sp. BT774]MDO3628417.1 nitroreductase family protein [Mucilaginibacter sp. BT774]